jgi:hypothetical protein
VNARYDCIANKLPNNVPRDSPEYIAVLALQEAGGNCQRALERARLAVKILSRWKLQGIIDTGSTVAAISPITRLIVDFDPADQ